MQTTRDSDDRPGASAARRWDWRLVLLAAAVLLALAVRAYLFRYQTADAGIFQSWYQYIAQHGHFAALKDDFANYNEPYLYLLVALTYVPVPALIGIKAIAVAFDLLLATFTFLIVRLRYPTGWLPAVAAIVVLFLPTVVLNSSFWGQVDAGYASLGLAGLYFLLRRRPWLACLFLGLALAFKQQIVFLFPLLLLLAARRYLPWRSLLLIPLVVVLLDVPALLVGARLTDLVSVYPSQTNLYQSLSLNAPNIYQYLGVAGATGDSAILRYLGIGVTGAVVVALVALVTLRRIELTPTRIVMASAVSVLLVPFLLPAMHERYFYLADGLAVIAAFYLPRPLWALPILEQFASVFSYLPFLLATSGFGRSPGPGAGTRTVVGGGRIHGKPGAGHPGQVLIGDGAAGHAVPAGSHGMVAGMQQHSLIDFRILATVMLAALVLALWMAVRQFRPAGGGGRERAA
jgi:Gpi18-like mannosyltransferase